KNKLTKPVMYTDNGFVGIPIRHTYSTFGILIVLDTLKVEELRFIGYVSGMIFKKIELETINQELLLSEEQNRIANEIHDSVLQKLFGVSCRLFTTTKKIDTLERECLKDDLDDMRGHITEAMTELRSTIYGLSWNKLGKNDFLDKLEHYIDTMQDLYGVDITLQVEGNIQLLQLQAQKALYRICCEAIANGIRHGKATCIDLMIDSGLQDIHMTIRDNGQGFDYNKVVEEGKLGLGIKNMEQLAQQLKGVLRIKSAIGQGTSLEIHIQHNIDTLQKNKYEKGII
ncbi:MAG: histidine kinase, partial [Niameybacter sp.]